MRTRQGVHFLGGGFALWLFWQLTNIAGYFAGNLIPAAWSLDFAVPLCFIALVAPHFRSVADHRCCGCRRCRRDRARRRCR